MERIVGIADPAIRNLEITYCYWRLSAAVADRGSARVNWCTFATWASRQAGRTIRGEDVLDRVERELGDDAELLHPIRSLTRWLLRRGRLQRLHTPFDALRLASDAVGRGNLKVFEEIGLVFARWLDGLGPPDEPPLLRQAFARYAAAGEGEPIVLANLEIGLHEQARLQPEIREALEAAVAPKRRQRWLAWPVQRELTKLSRELITESFMVLTLPSAFLELDRHLDVDLPPVEDAELRALLACYEPAPPAVDDCGATDWSVLDQRMHYIAHLFRAYQADASLADSQPFTPAQVERFRAGELPDGEL
ncbi:MAG: hypothetical protein FJW96_10770 [Actinobacteria bacterium]|nr:hypothetical protein [Actinomycetota bacterium]